MLRFLILRKLASVEREIGVSVDYVRHILRVSLGAFFKFAKVFPLIPVFDIKEGMVIRDEIKIGRRMVPATIHE